MKHLARLTRDKYILILVLVILLGFLLRLYNLPSLFYYTMDEEVMNLIQRRMVILEHFPLIGSVSPLHTYLGPLFYYFGAFILFLSSLNPLGLGFFGVMLGTFNIYLIFKVARELFNKQIAILAATFYSFSFLQVIFDRRYWHLSPGPFLSLLVMFSIYKIKLGNIKYIYLLVAALIFGWNTDYTNVVLFFFTFLAWIIFKLPIKRKEVGIAVLIFILSNAPLVLFDLRHDFLNAKAFVSYFTTKLSDEKVVTDTKHLSDRETLGETRQEQAMQTAMLPFITFSRSIYTLSNLDISEQHTYCKDYIFDRNKTQGLILPILASGLILCFAFLTFRRRKTKEGLSYKLVLSFYLIFQLGVLIYAFIFNGDVFEHYLATLLPHLFIILATVVYFIYSSRFKFLAVSLVGLFIVGNTFLISNAYNSLSYKSKVDAARFAIETVGQRDFSLLSIGNCYRYDGYYYPFILLGKHPVKSYQDGNYSWLYDYQVAEKHPSMVVVMVAKGRFEDGEFFDKYQSYQRWVINRANFGNLEVLILDNSKGDFIE